MRIKLSRKEYYYLLYHEKISDDLTVSSEESKVIIDLGEETVFELHDWVSDQLQLLGFDKNYELNADGKILDNLLDVLNI